MNQNCFVPKNQPIEDYLRELPFQHYASLTLPGKKSIDHANFLCNAWLDGLERHARSPVGAVRVLELGWRRIHPHYHLLLLSKATLDADFGKEFWFSLSRTRSPYSIKIEPYDPCRGALTYVLKLHGTDRSELELRKIEYFLPTPSTFWTRNARSRRQFRRHIQRRVSTAP